MKKSLPILVSAAMLALVACGPSAEEMARQKQATDDSLKRVMDDSLAMVQQQADEAARHMQDSLMMAAQMDSMKMAAEAQTKGAKPKTPAKPKLIDPGKKDQKPEDVKPGTGRG